MNPAEVILKPIGKDTLAVQVRGCWKLGQRIPSADEISQYIEGGSQVQRVVFDTRKLEAWDSSLLSFLLKLVRACARKELRVEKEGLPPGVQKLLVLASAVPERKEAKGRREPSSFLWRMGEKSVQGYFSALGLLDFIGDTFLAFVRFLGGAARFRGSDLWRILQDSGVQALPIVSLISFLVGLILAFVGAVQLKMFGAQIFVADLVAIAMAREMSAIMTGIIMAGRTGAAFAAQLGTMQVNEEIDALVTLGISPTEFLVLPRILALVLMMPLLCIYSDLMGVLGGVVVATGLFDISLPQYLEQTRTVLNLTHLSLGVFKAGVFGVVVAFAGCLKGIRSGRSASAVGAAATEAVVSSIVWIIVLDGIFAVITNRLGI